MTSLSSRLVPGIGLALLLAACAPTAPAPSQSTGSAPAPAPAQQDWKLNVGIASLITTMDPHASIGQNPRRYGVYECLVGQDENGALEPALATSWTNLNPTTWQFKLAQGRKFSDGTPVTAEDVKFSLDRSFDPNLKLAILTRMVTVEKVDIVDAQTINITTKGPDPLLLKRVALVGILSKAYVTKVGDKDFNLNGMGTGPYMQKEYVSGDKLVLTPNPNWDKKNNGATEVTVRQIPELSARVAGIRTGELDLIGAVSTDQADILKGQGNTVINFNQGRSQGAFIFTTLADQPTAKKEVRQAMNYAVNKDAIAQQIFKGYTKPEAGQVLQSTTVGYNPNIKAYPHDVNKAKQLLAQAGYPNGITVKLDVYNNTPDAQAVWLLIQSQMKEAGITAELNVFADNAFFLDRWYARATRSNTLSASLLNSPAMDADFAFSWFRGNLTDPERRYNSPEFDAVYLPSTTELDEKKRVELLQKAVAVMHEDAPYLFLTEGFEPWVANNKIANVKVRGDQEPRLDIITRK